MTGMVIKAEPIGEYDKRVVLLTLEKGKISAFAKSARRPNNKLMAATNPFCFGTFKLYVGRSSYNITDIEVSNYFENLRMDYEAAYYGMYFLEISDFYTRENNDERNMLKLLYQSLRALGAKSLNRRLVRSIFEIKSIVVNGEFPGIGEIPGFRGENGLLQDTVAVIQYINASCIEKLYTFKVSDEVLAQLIDFSNQCRKCFLDKDFKSIEILENLR